MKKFVCWILALVLTLLPVGITLAANTMGDGGFIIPVVGGMPKAGTNGFIAPISAPDPDATVIHTAEELQNIKNNLLGNYILGNDIDLSEFNDGVWIPIGKDTGAVPRDAFKGTLDGAGYKITNLNIPESKVLNAGLFGYATNCLIKNLSVKIKDGGVVSAGSSSINNPSSGVIVGYGSTVMIENSFVIGDVSAMSTSSYSLPSSGGLVGRGGTIIIKNSYSTGNVSATSSSSNAEVSSGGLVGSGIVDMGSSGGSTVTIENSYSTCNISATSTSSNANISSGGLLGCGITIKIDTSYASGNVSTTSSSETHIGGLVGYGYSTITVENSNATGVISATSSSATYVGGLVGFGGGTITNSYSSGDVLSNSSASNAYAGGLLGGGGCTIENSYAMGGLSATASKEAYRGGMVGYVSSKTTFLPICYYYADAPVYGAPPDLEKSSSRGWLLNGLENVHKYDSSSMPTNTGGDSSGNTGGEANNTTPSSSLPDSWFFQDNTKYNHDMAILSAKLSESIYTSGATTKLLTSFTDIQESFDSFDEYAFATKKLKDNNGTEYTLFVVTIQGTDGMYSDEMISNINVDAGTGFEYSAEPIYSALKKYISKHTNQEGYCKFLITGHSRGGAIANRIAKNLIDDTYGSANVYSYTFAAPGTRPRMNGSVEYKNETKYNSLFNICNDKDIVPKFLPTWGHYGKTLWFSHDYSTEMFGDHDMKHYLSYVSGSGKYESSYTVKSGWAACPIDLNIYDGSTLIGQVVDNKITVEDDNKLQLLVIDDVKYFWFPADSQYTIKFKGTATGTMDYYIQEVDLANDELITSNEWTNVELYKGKEMSSQISADVGDTKLLAVNNDGSTYEIKADWKNPFTDIKESDWFYNNVKIAYQSGLINGSSPTTFSPNNNLTYAEAVKLAACMYQLYTTGSVSLTNDSPNWYQSYVDYAKKNKIINKDYDWTAQATRAGYMEIFANALPDNALPAINSVADGSIPDVPATHPNAAAIYKLYRAGIVQGVDVAHNCNPSSNISRSEVAAILTRMMDKSARVKFSLK